MSKKNGWYGFEILGEGDRRKVASILADNGYRVQINDEPDEKFPSTRTVKVTWVKTK